MSKSIVLLALVCAVAGILVAACAVAPAPGNPTACSLRLGALPDPACNPGQINPEVVQDNIDQTICVPGYTRTIRPPASYTDALKVESITAYGYADTNPRDYEEDHLIPLELGGNPTDPKNLWAEPRYGSPNASDKDKVENYLHTQVCAHALTLAEAQQGIANNWLQYLPGMAAGAYSVEDAGDR